MLAWIAENNWLFGGVLVAVPLAVIGWIIQVRLARKKDDGKRNGAVQSQRSGKNSINLQAGNDIGGIDVGRSAQANPEERE